MKNLPFIATILFVSTIVNIFGQTVGKNIYANALAPIQAIPTKNSVSNSTITENPVRIRIPSLNISAPIEAVSVDKLGRMAVPTNPEDVSWYEPGVKPGNPGNAVIAGHLNTPNNRPAIFWQLSSMEQGQEVYVDYPSGKTIMFIVKEKKEYALNDLPLEEIFANDTDSNLQLITCSGDWNEAQQTYTHRIVVFTDKI